MGKERIFIAVPIPPAVRKRLFALSLKWANLPCRWLKQENLHLTIIPPMYLSADEFTRMAEPIREALQNVNPFSLFFEKIVYGPPGKPSRMIWAVGKPSEKLSQLKKTIEEAILNSGVPFREELRPLKPHLTLARFYQQEWRNFEPKPKIEEAFPFEILVDSVDIMQSELKRGGAEYTVLESIPLGP
jgi:2'-5' RNA ligase